MMQKTGENRFEASGLNASVHVLCERHNRGEIAVCPKCSSDLIVAFDWDIANKHSGHPGIFCPKDAKHFQILFNIQRKNSSTTDDALGAAVAPSDSANSEK